jgi:hypothetical protein
LSDAFERFTLIPSIFRQTAGRVKGGASRRSEPLTRFAVCLIPVSDGSNCNHDIDVSTVAARRAAYSLLRTRGLIREALSLPANADFEVAGVSNPCGCSETNVLSMYRRPLPSTNLRFLSSVMWDERESSEQTGTVSINTANYPNSLNDDLTSQAVNAATGHAQATGSPPPWRRHVVAFEMDLTTAQSATVSAGPLDAGGAKGGTAALGVRTFSSASMIGGAQSSIRPFRSLQRLDRATGLRLQIGDRPTTGCL